MYPYGEFQVDEDGAANSNTDDARFALVHHQGLLYVCETGNYCNRVRYYIVPLGAFNTRDRTELVACHDPVPIGRLPHRASAPV
ncbi:MAG: hypothetical protein PVI86_11750 [Phycisphaerae bacterium]|jgi:hypothetical protein